MTVRGGDFVHRVARRISKIRTDLGLTQEALAAHLGIATKNVQRIESGRQNLTLASVERVARALRIQPEELFLSVPRSPVRSTTPSILEALAASGYAVRAATQSGRKSSSSVPIVNLRAAAGSLRTARAIDVLGWVDLKRSVRGAATTFVARIEGDSMEPQIPNGAFVLFRRGRLRPARGHVYLFEHATTEDVELGGPYVIKKMGSERKLANGKTRVVLESNNPKHPPLVLQLDDANELRVVAELVEVLPQSPAK